MHEFSIAYDIYATARKTALDHHARQVTRVDVDIGEMSMINPEQVEFLFGTLIEDDELLKGAKLACNVVKTVSRCKCGYEGNERFVCPVCGALPEIIRGREVVVSNIEIEVDDE